MPNDAGDALLVACRQGADQTSISSVTDSAGNSYIKIASSASGGASGNRQDALYVAMNVPASGANTISCNFASNLTKTEGIVVEEFSGVASASVVDQGITISDSSGAATAVSTGSITTTNANDLLVCEINASTDESFTAGWGYVIPANGSNARQAMQYRAVASVGSYVAAISWVNPASADGVFVALRGTSSATVPVAVSVSPGSASLLTGGTQQFTASVTGTSNTAVTWSVTGGSISSAGLYTAPATAGTYTVKAVSAADTTKSASATVTVTTASSLAFVRAANNLSSTGGTSISVNMTNNAGDALLVACRQGADQTSIVSVTDSAGNSYTKIGSSASGGNREDALFLATNVLARAANTISCNFASNLTATEGIVAEEFSGVASASVVDQSTAISDSSGATTALSTGSVTTTNANDLLVYEITASTDESFTAGSGYVVPTNGSNARQAMQYRTVASLGSYTASISWTAPASADGVFVALRGANSATPPPASPVQHSVTLSWNGSTSTVVGYNIYRSTVAGGPYTMINTALNAPTNYTDFTVQSGKTYFYVTTAVDASNNESAYSNQVQAVVPSP
ncbi:MAG TPA: hypothetical protein VE734_04955 [Terriglobales bacterium]|nr:hypothetical protein [Terriglobales bacterium]